MKEENNFLSFMDDKFGQIRVAVIDGNPYFVGNDVAIALGYATPKDAVSRHCKGAILHRYPTNGGDQQLKVIPKGDIFRLAARSKLPNCEEFESWIFDTVLPTIDSTGGYVLNSDKFVDMYFGGIDNSAKALLSTMLEASKRQTEMIQQQSTVITQQTQTITQQTGIITQQTEAISVLEPKAKYADLIMQTTNLLTITQIAKDYGMGGKEMNDLLHNKGIQFKKSGQWMLYQKYADKGYVGSDTVAIPHHDGSVTSKLNTKWTQKGRMFIYELLKKDNLLPVIER